MKSKIVTLTEKIQTVAPIDGAARLKDGSVRIDFKDDATDTQKEDAKRIANVFDWNAPDPEEEKREALKTKLRAGTATPQEVQKALADLL